MRLPAYRRMTGEDIRSVLRIQEECYPPQMQEHEAIVRSRLEAASDTAWVAVADDGICAYLFSYPSILGKVTPLGGSFHIPDEANALYLHDLAVSKRAAGLRIGPVLVRVALETAIAQGLTYSALVSVQDTSAFWSRQGYKVLQELDATQISNLHTYPGESCYMVRSLIDIASG